MKLNEINGPVTKTKTVLTEGQLAKRLEFVRRKREGLEGVGLVFEAYSPWDSVNRDKDIAFGVTRDMDYLDAAMVTDPDGNTPPKSGMGLISHGQLLQMAGKTEDADDPNPSDDYVVRGIVKANLKGMVIFWESNQEILRRMAYVKTALKSLLDRGLVKDTDEVWGANEKDMLAYVFEIAQS